MTLKGRLWKFTSLGDSRYRATSGSMFMEGPCHDLIAFILKYDAANFYKIVGLESTGPTNSVPVEFDACGWSLDN
jgi:hypothetical protein